MFRFRAVPVLSPTRRPILATALSPHGAVTGRAEDEQGLGRAFLWTPTSFSFLPTLGGPTAIGQAINRHNSIAGYSEDASGRQIAFLYSRGRLIHLGTLGGDSSMATGVNDRDVVIGSSPLDNGETRAFRWVRGLRQSLGTLGGDVSVATAINASGHIAGHSNLSHSGPIRGFLFRSARLIPVATLGGTQSELIAINDQSQAVGISDNAAGQWGMFLYDRGRLTPLGSPQPYMQRPNSLNNHGMVVGITADSTGLLAQAFLWHRGVFHDLNALTVNPLPAPLVEAVAINDSRQILVRAANAATFLLNPSPTS